MSKAKKVRTTTTEIVEPSDETTETLALEEGEESSDDADLIRALREIEGADDVRWNVTRVMPIASAGFCCTLNSAELTLEYLSDELGPGKYRVRGFTSGGRFAGGRTVTIAAPPKGKEKKTGDAPGDLLGALREERRAEREESNERWLRLATVLGPLLGPVLANLFKAGPSLTDMTAALANIKQLQPESKSEMDTLLKGIELAAKFSENKGGETTMLDILREGIHSVKPMIERMLPSAGAASAPPALLGPNPPPNVSTGTMPQGDPMLQLIPWLRGSLRSLIEQARKDKEPALYAEVTLDNLPEGLPLTMLRDLIAREDWWLVLQQFDSGVTAYEGWFKRFREEALAMIEQALADADEETTATPQGETPDV